MSCSRRWRGWCRPRPLRPSLTGRLQALDADLAGALAQLDGGVLPPRFADRVTAIDRRVLALGEALPGLGGGAARGSVVFYARVTVLHGQVGHALRMTHEAEPELVVRDLRRARGTLRLLAEEVG